MSADTPKRQRTYYNIRYTGVFSCRCIYFILQSFFHRQQEAYQ